MLDEDSVVQAAAAIRQARHVYIFGLAYTAFVARELEFKLSMVGLFVKALTDISDIRVCAGNVGPEDLVIVIAPTILVRDLYHALAACKDKGAEVLSITSYDSPKLASLVQPRSERSWQSTSLALELSKIPGWRWDTLSRSARLGSAGRGCSRFTSTRGPVWSISAWFMRPPPVR